MIIGLGASSVPTVEQSVVECASGFFTSPEEITIRIRQIGFVGLKLPHVLGTDTQMNELNCVCLIHTVAVYEVSFLDAKDVPIDRIMAPSPINMFFICSDF